jgi:hypothetical protein
MRAPSEVLAFWNVLEPTRLLRAEPLLVAPVGKHSTYVLGSGYIFRDLLDGVDNKRPELNRAKAVQRSARLQRLSVARRPDLVFTGKSERFVEGSVLSSPQLR